LGNSGFVGSREADTEGRRELLDQVLSKFYELREKPSTSELIDWISALLKKEQDVDALLKYDEKGGRFPKSWQELGPRYNQ
jgi:hypothetical protein